MIIRNGEAHGSILADALTKTGKVKAEFAKAESADADTSMEVTRHQQNVVTEDTSKQQAKQPSPAAAKPPVTDKK